MFEKEAEEYAENREVCGLLDAISENLQNYDYGTVAHYNIDPLVEECFKDGATFGYNKAKEEMQAQIEKLKSCSNCIHYSSTFGLCHYSMGDEDYDCRGRKWEIKENDRRTN